MCNNDIIDGSKKPFGVITSPNYPQWIPNQSCRVIINTPTAVKVIRVYISDISVEPAEVNGLCEKSFLAFYSGNVETKYCGNRRENGDYVYISCSNSLEILWRSSSIVSSPLRGFNIYYEIVDKLNIKCPNVTLTTRQPVTTGLLTISNEPFFFLILNFIKHKFEI